MESKIFMVAVMEIPTKKEMEDNNAQPTLVLQPTAVIARDDKDAALKVAIGNKALENVNKDRIQVVVRPF